MRHTFSFIEFGARKKLRWKGRIFFYLLVIILILAGFFLVFHNIYAGAIWPRVKVGNIDLAGLKPCQARVLLEIAIQDLERKGLSFYARTSLGEKRVAVQPTLISLSDPDLSRQIISFDIAGTLEKAYSVGRKGSIFQRLLDWIGAFKEDKIVDLDLKIDREELKKILRENFIDLEKPTQNAGIKVSERGELTLTSEEYGFALDYEAGIARAEDNLQALDASEVRILVFEDVPEIKVEECGQILSQTQYLIAQAPFILKSENKSWELTRAGIGEWLHFTKIRGEVKLAFNEVKIISYLAEIASQIDVPPLDAKFRMENNRVVEFEPSREGSVLNKEKSVSRIAQSILAYEEGKTKEIELVVERVQPENPIENINDLGIKELIGRGVSNFQGSPKNRRYNIKIGAQKLHGILIVPDEEFSLVKAIGEITKEEGFLPELVIKGDRTIPEFGGGLCQIGTTAFRVALDAGLPITARTPHSYRVVYYEPAGMDATIYRPKPDFKFINDTGKHILFQTKIEGDELIFEFYGTSDGRVVEITQPKIFNITSPPPARFIETDQLAPGEKKRIEIAHKGADTEFTQTVTFPNGTRREEVWKSHYKAWPEVWLVGKEEELQNEN